MTRGRVMGLLAVLLATAAAADDSRGRQVFDRDVVPALVENGCAGCHAVGYVYPAFRYEDYRRFLAMGRSGTDNYLVRKVSDPGSPASPPRPAHMGGLRCRAGADDACRALARWWDAEFGSRR